MELYKVSHQAGAVHEWAVESVLTLPGTIICWCDNETMAHSICRILEQNDKKVWDEEDREMTRIAREWDAFDRE